MRAKIIYARGGTQYTIDGKDVTKREFDKTVRDKEAGSAESLSRSEHWKKHESIACGVHPSQVNEHREYLRQHGFTAVEVTNSGSIKFMDGDSKQRQEYLSRRGLADYSSAGGSGHNGSSIPSDTQKPYNARDYLPELRKAFYGH